jgi:hypothetical protein
LTSKSKLDEEDFFHQEPSLSNVIASSAVSRAQITCQVCVKSRQMPRETKSQTPTAAAGVGVNLAMGFGW